MPVPTLLTDLSATIASNSPAGSDNVFPDLDGYLRSLSGFLASIRDNSGNGWVSPYLSAANPVYTGTLTGGTGVVNLGSGQFYKDASGNVGLGVVPSAWNASTKNIQTPAGAIYSIGTATIGNVLNAYLDSGGVYKYVNTGAASYFAQSAGAFDWASVGSGTGGTTAGLTTKMTLDASGNLGVGTATPAAKLNVVSTGQSVVKVKGGASAGQSAAFYVERAGSTTTLGAFGDSAAILGGTVDQAVAIYADSSIPITFNQSSTERMRIDASGNLGLGVVPAAHATGWRFMDVGNYGSIGQQTTGTNSVNIGWNAAGRTGGNAWNYRVTGDSAKMLEIDTAGFKFYSTATTGTAGNQITTFTQAMTLDGGGNLLVATTSAPAYTSKMRLQGGLEIHGAQQHNVAPGNTNPYEIVNRSNGGFDFYPTATTLAARITSAGDLLITGAGGLGYGTGSGGAVTQITSRTTGVTLNKTNGAITLVSAAGTATWQSFAVTNSTVAATDTVIVCQKSGTDKYLISVTGVNAGSFAVTFATTGGTTTEQPVFNFAVIKAVTA